MRRHNGTEAAHRSREGDDALHPSEAAHAGTSVGEVVPDPGYMTRKDDYHRRLQRIEGQVRGINRMVEEETYCIDILTQVSAVTSALEKVALGLLGDHLAHCVADAAKTDGHAADRKVKEATDAIARLVRS